MGLFKLSNEQLFDRIRLENPWWNSGRIQKNLDNMVRRSYYARLFDLITNKKVDRSVVLMGPRRVGKTVLLHHIIRGLLDSGVHKKKICYLSLDTPLYNKMPLEILLYKIFKAAATKSRKGFYVFFDEIQYLKDWEIHLKSLVDIYRDIRFVASGSSAAALKLKSSESGAGRFTDFILPPLTFAEFIDLTDKKEIIDEEYSFQNIFTEEKVEEKIYNSSDSKNFNKLFHDYINFGGYPELSLNEEVRKNTERYVKGDIIDKVLLRDLPSMYGISDIQELNSLFNVLSFNTGNEIALESLAKNSGVAKNTIKKYIEYLEAAFLIRIVHRVDENAKRFSRANYFKVYLTNTSLRAALFAPAEEKDSGWGNLVETAIFSQWEHSLRKKNIHYSRWRSGEVDLIYLANNQKPVWALEVKSGNAAVDDNRLIRNIIKFCHVHNLKDAFVTTSNVLSEKEYQNVKIHFIPAAAYCYTIGKRLTE